MLLELKHHAAVLNYLLVFVVVVTMEVWDKPAVAFIMADRNLNIKNKRQSVWESNIVNMTMRIQTASQNFQGIKRKSCKIVKNFRASKYLLYDENNVYCWFLERS